MTITVEATYENGTLRLAQPLPLKESENVRVTIEVEPGPLLRASGIMGWQGDAETIVMLGRSAEKGAIHNDRH
jgi:predicted DNA-binding antitoxin AbrB/MazE fold protein